MEDLVGAEVFVARIEKGKLQAVDDASDGVDNAACKEPSEACSWQGVKNGDKCKYAKPAHSDVKYRGYPFGTGDPETFQDDAKECDGPYEDAQDIADFVVQGDKADGRIASCNHDKDHHVVYFAQPAVDFFCGIYRVVNGTGCIKQNHSQYKNTQSRNVQGICISACLKKQRQGTCNGKQHSNSMCDGASWVF